jgi:succinoglycan biosynthesis protein ExoM
MTKPHHVAVAIATYRRPDGLRRLLASLDALSFQQSPRPDITVVVIDNDADASLPGSSDKTRDIQSRYPLMYRIEPAKGLATVRNACLDAAPADADFIAYIDDDEWAEPQWLDALLAMQTRTGADIVQGVVRPAYSAPAPAWMQDGRYHEVGPFEDGAPLTHGASGNILIRRAAIQAAGARFHQDFNHSGGEDVDFFAQLLAAGARMVAASNAVAHEDIPPDRMTFGWVLRRRYRTGHTLGLIARNRGGRANRTIKALGRMGMGAAESCLGLITSRGRLIRGATDVAWGAGTLAALYGRAHKSSVKHY